MKAVTKLFKLASVLAKQLTLIKVRKLPRYVKTLLENLARLHNQVYKWLPLIMNRSKDFMTKAKAGVNVKKAKQKAGMVLAAQSKTIPPLIYGRQTHSAVLTTSNLNLHDFCRSLISFRARAI